MSINPDFRIRFVRKSEKTVFHVCLNFGSTSGLTRMVGVSMNRAWPKDSKNAHKSGFPDPVCPENRKKRKNFTVRFSCFLDEPDPEIRIYGHFWNP